MNGPVSVSGDKARRHGLGALRAVVTSLPDAAVAVSGGVDSMTLAFLVHRWLGARATMFHAVSPAVPVEATARVRELAARQGWDLQVIDAGEFRDGDYLANPVNRCFFCKGNLYGAIASLTDRQVLSGANLDDLGDYRPGLKAAENFAVRHPFIEAGISKAAIRRIAGRFGLRDLSELPSSPCLSSRVATGIAIAVADLGLIADVERLLRARFPAAADLRCRRLADRLEIQIDGHLLDGLSADARDSLVAAVGGIAAQARVDLPIALAAYRRGSAFLHEAVDG
jgi:uncharacterized protein